MADEFSDEELIKIHSLALEERTGTVRGLLNQGKTQDALVESLRKPPLAVKNDDIKSRSSLLVGDVLTAIKEADVNGHCNALNDDQIDILMKYIYKGLATCENSNVYLRWHEAAKAKGGLGCIIRALAEKKNILDEV